MPHKLTADGADAVAPDVHWLPITPATPIGVRMQLIERAQGVAYTRTHFANDGFDHWFPIPTFSKDDNES